MEGQTKEIFDFLNAYPENVQGIALRLRKIVKSAISEAREELDRSARIIGYGLGPGYAGVICTIIPSKKGVKLGIAHGTQIADPRGLLEGSGKVHRYIVFATRSDLERSGLKDLLRAAVAAWRKRSGQNAC